MPVPDIQKVLDKLERGESSDVLPTLTYLNELLPSGLATCILLARAYEVEKNWRAALSTWQEAFFLMPNSPIIQKGIQRCARFLSEMTEIAAQTQIKGDKTEIKDPTVTDLTLALSAAPRTQSPGAQSVEISENIVSTSRHPGASLSDSDRPQQHASPSAEAGDEKKINLSDIHNRTNNEDLEQYNDLDRLINALNSARIVPDPEMDAYPPLDLENDVEDIVSETLARIYAAQQQYGEAARVYELLAKQQPSRAPEFREKAEWMRKQVRPE